MNDAWMGPVLPEDAVATSALRRLQRLGGRQLDRRGGPGLRGGFGLGLDHRAYAALRIARRGHRLASADDLEELGDRVVGNVVPAHFVAAALDACIAEHLHLVGLAVVFEALGEALDEIVEAFALLPEVGRAAVGNPVLEAVGILLDDEIGRASW